MNINYFIKAFKSEWLKTKGLGLLILSIILGALLPLILLTVSLFVEEAREYTGLPSEVSTESIQTFFSGFGSFMMVIFIIIAAIRICQTDHKNNGWVFMESQPLSKLSIYTGKFLSAMTLTLICITTFIVSSVAISSLQQLIFPQKALSLSIDFSFIIHTYIRLIILSLGIVSLQLMLSLVIRGFIWPFVIGVMGFVINITGQIRQETYDYIPYNNLATAVKLKDSSMMSHFLNYTEYLSIFWAVLFFVIGYTIYANRGVKAAFFKNGKTIAKTLVGLTVAVGIYFGITSPIYPEKLDGKTIIEGTVNTVKKHKEISLYSNELNLPVAKIPIKNGKFFWESTENLPLGEYTFNLGGNKFGAILSKGDHLKIQFNADEKQSEVNITGSRNAEFNYLKQQMNEGQFYSYFVNNKEEYLDKPEYFYDAAEKEWNDSKKHLDQYRTEENIYFGRDFYEYMKQKNAAKMINALHDFQTISLANDKKNAAPTALTKELNEIIKNPTEMLMASKDFTKMKLNQLLPKEGSKNPDSTIMAKLNTMPKSKEKDRLLKTQLLSYFEMTNDENKRNQLFESRMNEFSDTRFRDFVAKELFVINNQQKGKPMPTITFEDALGKSFDLKKYKGKYVVIDFWATWCGPCRETKPKFEYLAKQYSYNNNLVFLSLSVDENKNNWKMNVKNNKSKAVQMWLKNKEIMQLLGINGIPRFMLVDPEGKIYNANLPFPYDSQFDEIINEISNKTVRIYNF